MGVAVGEDVILARQFSGTASIFYVDSLYFMLTAYVIRHSESRVIFHGKNVFRFI